MLESSVNFESIMISTVSKLLSRREERLKWIAATKFKIEITLQNSKFKILNLKSLCKRKERLNGLQAAMQESGVDNICTASLG